MINVLKPRARVVLASTAAIATALLIGLPGAAWARIAAPSPLETQPMLLDVQAFSPGQSVLTSRGPAFVTGQFGNMETTTIPGSGGEGFLMNNGNGTSTLITPGGLPQTVGTPR
jgi:hypothetical protein